MASRGLDTGVYLIMNTVNGRLYVGSALRLRNRWKDHQRQLSQGRHHSRFLQRAWDKYGPQAFRFESQLYCNRDNLLRYEQALIDFYRPDYNSRPTAGNQFGFRHSPESRAKMSASNNRTGNPGYKHSEESKRQISNNRKGKGGGAMSPERAAEISAALKGRPCPVERRTRISSSLTGRKQSQETIDKRVKKLIGRKMPNGFGDAVSERMKGRKLSALTIEKISRKRSKLTDDQVRYAKKQLNAGVRQRAIAAELCVDSSVISEISCGKSYKWVD